MIYYIYTGGIFVYYLAMLVDELFEPDVRFQS